MSQKNLSDIMVVARFFNEEKGEDVYECVASSMPVHEALGLAEIATHILHERRKL